MDMYASALSPALDIGTGCYLLVVGTGVPNYVRVNTADFTHAVTKNLDKRAVLSIIGNLLVIITAAKKSSKMKPPELLCVNLAVTDLGAAVTMYPLSVASAWSHRWIGGDVTCIYYGLVGFLFGVASIMSLTALAIVRFTVSLNLQSPKEKISWKSVKILCLWIWLYSVIWAMFPILGWGRYGPEPFGISCSLAWGQMKNEGFSFIIAMFSFNLAMPAVVIVCCYFGIAINLYFTHKKTMNNGNRIPVVIKLHRRLLTIAVLISVGFLGCWAPYGLVSLWSILKDSSSIPPEVSLLPCMFAKSATVYNPMIYYIFSQNFKMEVRQLFLCCVSFRSGRTNNYNNNESSIFMVSSGKKSTIAQMQEEASHAVIMN